MSHLIRFSAVIQFPQFETSSNCKFKKSMRWRIYMHPGKTTDIEGSLFERLFPYCEKTDEADLPAERAPPHTLLKDVSCGRRRYGLFLHECHPAYS
jgi:hypothetical protein